GNGAPGARTQVRLAETWTRWASKGPRRDSRRSGAPAPAQRTHAAHGEARVRQGLQVRARLRGPRRARHELSARVAAGPSLLRPDGARRGGQAQDAARGPPPAKRARKRPISNSRYIGTATSS